MKNPILAGFSPDPSICRVGADYYLVTSTFAYFPGVPIYHSVDLENWQLIGNVLSSQSQLNLTGAKHSGGIFAPCLRYHQGVFYLITTNVTHGGNFYVTATNPAGPWSDPYFLPEAPGIDPSLFFDDDRCYYVGTRPRQAGVRYDGDWEIWVQELDLLTHHLIGESSVIWKGALRKVIWPEGPHLYKRDGWYYLLIAEAGTGFQHAISVARSKTVTGWYEGNPSNPIFTHRHLGRNYPVQKVGHGDLVEKSDGTWALTCLASRMFNGTSNLGRETYLATVIWEEDWPVVNPGLGRLDTDVENEVADIFLDLTQPLPAEVLFLRNPECNNYRQTEDGLALQLTPVTLTDFASPSYVALRQNSMNFRLKTWVTFSPQSNHEEAGLVILQNNLFSIRLVLKQVEQQVVVQVIKMFAGQDEVLASKNCEGAEMDLEIVQTGQTLSFFAGGDQADNLVVALSDASFLSTEVAGGFVGNTLGIYASSNAEPVNNEATFKYLALEQGR